MVADGMEVKKLDDIPMSAMWVQKPGVNKIMYGYNADDRESASVAHIYGQNIAAAESMTSCNTSTAWAWSPATLKPTADQEFLNGINRFVIHESAHQALVGKAPGLLSDPAGSGSTVTRRGRSRPMSGRNTWREIPSCCSRENLPPIFSISTVRIQTSPSSMTRRRPTCRRVQLRLHQCRRFDPPTKRGEWTDHHEERHEVIRCWRSTLTASICPCRCCELFTRWFDKGGVVAGAKPIGDPSLADNIARIQQD